MTGRPWSDTGLAIALAPHLDPDDDPDALAGSALMMLHAIGNRALHEESGRLDTNPSMLSRALSGVDDDAMIGAVCKALDDAVGIEGYGAQRLPSLKGEADAGARTVAARLAAEKVPWPLALRRAGEVYGIGPADAAQVAGQMAGHDAVAQLAGDRALMSWQEQLVRAEIDYLVSDPEPVAKGVDTFVVDGRTVTVNRDKEGRFARKGAGDSAAAKRERAAERRRQFKEQGGYRGRMRIAAEHGKERENMGEAQRERKQEQRAQQQEEQDREQRTDPEEAERERRRLAREKRAKRRARQEKHAAQRQRAAAVQEGMRQQYREADKRAERAGQRLNARAAMAMQEFDERLKAEQDRRSFQERTSEAFQESVTEEAERASAEASRRKKELQEKAHAKGRARNNFLVNPGGMSFFNPTAPQSTVVPTRLFYGVDVSLQPDAAIKNKGYSVFGTDHRLLAEVLTSKMQHVDQMLNLSDGQEADVKRLLDEAAHSLIDAESQRFDLPSFYVIQGTKGRKNDDGLYRFEQRDVSRHLTGMLHSHDSEAIAPNELKALRILTEGTDISPEHLLYAMRLGHTLQLLNPHYDTDKTSPMRDLIIAAENRAQFNIGGTVDPSLEQPAFMDLLVSALDENPSGVLMATNRPYREGVRLAEKLQKEQERRGVSESYIKTVFDMDELDSDIFYQEAGTFLRQTLVGEGWYNTVMRREQPAASHRQMVETSSGMQGSPATFVMQMLVAAADDLEQAVNNNDSDTVQAFLTLEAWRTIARAQAFKALTGSTKGVDGTTPIDEIAIRSGDALNFRITLTDLENGNYEQKDVQFRIDPERNVLEMAHIPNDDPQDGMTSKVLEALSAEFEALSHKGSWSGGYIQAQIEYRGITPVEYYHGSEIEQPILEAASSTQPTADRFDIEGALDEFSFSGRTLIPEKDEVGTKKERQISALNGINPARTTRGTYRAIAESEQTLETPLTPAIVTRFQYMANGESHDEMRPVSPFRFVRNLDSLGVYMRAGSSNFRSKSATGDALVGSAEAAASLQNWSDDDVNDYHESGHGNPVSVADKHLYQRLAQQADRGASDFYAAIDSQYSEPDEWEWGGEEVVGVQQIGNVSDLNTDLMPEEDGDTGFFM